MVKRPVIDCLFPVDTLHSTSVAYRRSTDSVLVLVSAATPGVFLTPLSICPFDCPTRDRAGAYAKMTIIERRSIFLRFISSPTPLLFFELYTQRRQLSVEYRTRGYH